MNGQVIQIFEFDVIWPKIEGDTELSSITLKNSKVMLKRDTMNDIQFFSDLEHSFDIKGTIFKEGKECVHIPRTMPLEFCFHNELVFSNYL